MAKFSRRHYEVVAGILNHHYVNDKIGGLDKIVTTFIMNFRRDNDRFNQARFTDAVYKDSGK